MLSCVAPCSQLESPGLLGTGSGLTGARMLEGEPLLVQDAHLKGESLTGKRANCVWGLLPWCFALALTCCT